MGENYGVTTEPSVCSHVPKVFHTMKCLYLLREDDDDVETGRWKPPPVLPFCALGTRSQHVAQAGLELTVLLQFLKGCTNVSEQCL